MAEFSVIGESVTRVDAFEKVTGKAMYFGTDFKLPGMLQGKVLWSPHPHARVLNIDTSKAEALPGVRAVVTAKDAPELKAFGLSVMDNYFLARDVVRFVGDAVAAVAADTVEIAEEAVGLIKVDYKELPAVFDGEEAMRKNPPAIVHPNLSTYAKSAFVPVRLEPDMPNVNAHHQVRRGDVEKGFQEADLIVENRFSVHGIQHCPLEPHGAVAREESDGSLTVWTGGQGVYQIKEPLCAALGMPPSKVRVLSSYTGGGFGGKVFMKVDVMVAVLLARKAGKPVRVSFTRAEEFVAGTSRNPFVIYIKDGVKKDGTLIAREMKVILSCGAYSDLMPAIARNCSFGAVAAYRMPNYKWDSYSVYTNTPIRTALRGLGTPEVLWAIEQQMDILAEKLGIDPVEIRRKNILREGEEHANGQPVHSIGARECLDKVADFIEWDKKPKAEGIWRRGKGIALGNKYTLAPGSESAAVRLHQDGTLEVRHSLPELGQGLNTVVAQITAEEFGVSMDRIKVVCQDTAFTPPGFLSASSRSTFYLGNAVRLACQDAKQQIFAIAANKLGASADDLETREGRVYVKGAPEKAIMLTDLWRMGSVGVKGEEIMGRGTYSFPGFIPEDPETGQSKRGVTDYTHGAQAVEVGVNIETGEVKVLRIGAAFDMGQPINPKMCEQQMEGGISMGISTTLFEELLMDNGRIINPDFVNYKIQTIMEMPSQENVKTMIAAVPHNEGPFGAKGHGEAVMAPTSAAIGNAVYNAVGIRIKDLPITREKVFKALKETGKS